jgi:putative ABC transport system permease protein
MAVLLRIAWRNLREHRAKTLIVGLIIALGIALLIFGNALMATAARGAKAYFIDNCGHLMIHGKGEGRCRFSATRWCPRIGDTARARYADIYR